ncbi:RimK family protein [Ectothiorhodospiraceae bacterium 2226]|nr:RimK family protein [Ectothiorhodospiraceae bacterium 2226]
MATYLVVVENLGDWKSHFPGVTVVSARDYLTDPSYAKLQDIRVVNLCRNYRYLSTGYYCSLLAEARRHKAIPSVRTTLDLSSRWIYSLNTGALDDLVQKSLGAGRHKPAATSPHELTIFFGRCAEERLQDLARQIFDMFRCPLMKVEFRLERGRWQIAAIKPVHLNGVTVEQEALFCDALSTYLHKPWKRPRTPSVARYDMAILFNPEEKLAPSDKRTLRQFIKVGKGMGLGVEIVEKKDFARLAEYDALFIRETTRLNHYTYRFAKKAESEGMVVMDDPNSILRCTNKVYLAELLKAHRVPAPKTLILSKANAHLIDSEIGYPAVLKIPDGSFSLGVFKADNRREVETLTAKLFKDSDLILAQEFLYTEYDWRIGILNRKPIFACQYFMSKQHWQIVNHKPGGKFVEGGYKAFAVEDAPPTVVKAALKAANLIGDGLYGVDVKQNARGVYVIEINDNPNIELGVEDSVLKDELYRIILGEFVRRLDLRGV